MATFVCKEPEFYTGNWGSHPVSHMFLGLGYLFKVRGKTVVLVKLFKKLLTVAHKIDAGQMHKEVTIDKVTVLV